MGGHGKDVEGVGALGTEKRMVGVRHVVVPLDVNEGWNGSAARGWWGRKGEVDGGRLWGKGDLWVRRGEVRDLICW